MTATDIALALHAKPLPGGGGWMVCCVAHDDRNPSMVIRDNPNGGRPLIRCYAGCTQEAVIDALRARGLWGGTATAPTQLVTPAAARKPGRPVGPAARCVATYDYCNGDGSLAYREQRFEAADGSKSFRASHPDGQGGWTYSLKGVTPLPYRLPELTASKGVVIVVEGEKCADAVRALGLTATTHHGGAGNAHVWRFLAPYLAGRSVIVLPDNDAPGATCAGVVAGHVSKVASRLRVLMLPGLPAGGDIVDWLAAGHTRDELIALAKACPEWDAAPIESEQPPPPTDEDHPDDTRDADEDAPARPAVLTPQGAEPQVEVTKVLKDVLVLGHDHGLFFFLPHVAGQVIGMSAASLCTPAGLMQLAPERLWESWFPSRNGLGGRLARTIGGGLMEAAYRIGIYDPTQARGRGAWIDNQRIVLHCGNTLVVDGIKTPRTEIVSHYVYETAAPIEAPEPPILAPDYGAELLRVLQLCSWSRPVDPYLLLGWCAIAPLSGLLRWRPHVWCSGASGSGKTWIVQNVIRPLLGRWSVNCQANTSEAGVRSRIRADALPVVFDELDRDATQYDQAMLQQILGLMRAASSDSGAIYKGGSTANGGGVFMVRSCCCVSSIHVALDHAQDEGRFSVLELVRDERADSVQRFWSETQPQITSLVTDQFCAAWRARAVSEARWIVSNTDTFSRVIAERAGSQRAGDQLGTLFAGVYAMTHGGEATAVDLLNLMPRNRLGAPQVESPQEDERARPLHRLMEHQIQVEGQNGRAIRRSVAELVSIAGNRSIDESGDVSMAIADAALSRHGVKVNETGIYVSNSHASIKEIYRNTTWAIGWSRHLARISGARQSESAMSFAGSSTRATWVPMPTWRRDG